MSERSAQPIFDPDAWISVQSHFRRLVQGFDSHGLLDPLKPDDETFVAMARATEDDESLAASLGAIAGMPWPYLYVEEPRSRGSRTSTERFLDETLPPEPEPREGVLAILRASELFPEDGLELQKVVRVRNFIEKEGLLDYDLPPSLAEELDRHIEGVGGNHRDLDPRPAPSD